MPNFPKQTHPIKILTLLCATLVLSACVSTVEPWERGTLAKQQMALTPDVQDAALREHTYVSKEAANGGYGVGGGGCGCN